MKYTGSIAIVVGAAILAAFLRFAGTRLVAPVGPVLAATPSQSPALGEPFSQDWVGAPSVQLAVSQPGDYAIRSARMSALSHGPNIYFLVEWPDATPDRSFKGSFAEIERGELLRDAMTLMIGEGDEPSPVAGMRTIAGGPRLLSWTSQWQTEYEKRSQTVVGEQVHVDIADMYPFEDESLYYPARAAGNANARSASFSPVSSRRQMGFRGAVLDPKLGIVGNGEWRNGFWRVVFVAPLGQVGPLNTIGVSVWDGGLSERDEMRGVSSFCLIRVSSSGDATSGSTAQAFDTGREANR